MLISDKADIKTRNIIKDEQEHYIMIKGLPFHKHTAILNV